METRTLLGFALFYPNTRYNVACSLGPPMSMPKHQPAMPIIVEDWRGLERSPSGAGQLQVDLLLEAGININGHSYGPITG